MRTQEEYLRLGPHGKTLVLPLVSDWGEVFESWSLDPTHKPEPHVFNVGPSKDDRCFIGPYLQIEFANGRQTINGYESTVYRGAPAIWARMRDEVARAVFSSTIGLSDVMTFHVIEWSAHEAVIICQYSKIIGSRWVAVINPATIPEEFRK